MPTERRASEPRRSVERFTRIVPRGRIRRAWSGAHGPMPQARARKVQCPCDKSMTSVQQNYGTRASKLRFCGSISPHGLVRTNPNWGFICHRSNAISRKWTQTAFFSRRISNSLHASLDSLQTMQATHAFRGLRNTRKRTTWQEQHSQARHDQARNAHGQKSTPSPQRSALRQKVPRISHETTRPPHAPSPQTKASPQPARPRGGSKVHSCQWLKPTRRRRRARQPPRVPRRPQRRGPPRPDRSSCRPNR